MGLDLFSDPRGEAAFKPVGDTEATGVTILEPDFDGGLEPFCDGRLEPLCDGGLEGEGGLETTGDACLEPC